jgi:adenylate cyclase class 2
MPIEIEKKYRLNPDQCDEIRQALRDAGASCLGTEFEENTLYKNASIDLNRAVLRVRRTPERCVLTYKERLPTESDIKHQEEDETEVSDPEALEKILLRLGCVPTVVYEKKRETWQLGDAEIVLDELPFGWFMEIEAEVDEIKRIERELGIEMLPAETETYPRLAVKHGTRSGDLIESRFER